jgi:hypothetical protein
VVRAVFAQSRHYLSLLSSVALHQCDDPRLVRLTVELGQEIVRAQLVEITPPSAASVVPDPVAARHTPGDVASSAHTLSNCVGGGMGCVQGRSLGFTDGSPIGCTRLLVSSERPRTGLNKTETETEGITSWLGHASCAIAQGAAGRSPQGGRWSSGRSPPQALGSSSAIVRGVGCGCTPARSSPPTVSASNQAAQRLSTAQNYKGPHTWPRVSGASRAARATTLKATTD